MDASSRQELTYRGVVQAEDCDALGHMNVQHYFRMVSSGMFVLMERLGLGPAEIARRRLSFAVVRAETDFPRELHAGDEVALESTITALGEKRVTFQHRLRIGRTGEVAMSTDYRCVLLDLDRRRATAVPADLVQKAHALFPDLAATQAEHGGSN
jgi:acyl-CoA thioester hydrolase